MSTPALLVLLLASAQGAAPQTADAPARIELGAVMDARPLEVGEPREFVLELDLGEGVSLSEAGIPSPILQIEVPPSVKLGGRYLRTYEELADNEFLNEPFERLLKGSRSTIAFELTREPGPDERLGLNVIGYQTSDGGKRTSFLRRRLELPLTAGARALEVAATRSSWGADPDLLQIGDDAAEFVLPMADGVELALEEFLGEQNVLVTTYRAFW